MPASSNKLIMNKFETCEVCDTCVICGSKCSLLMNKDGYDLYKCKSCELVFVYPQPSDDFLKEEVYSEKSGYQGNKSRDLASIIPTRKQDKLVSYLKGLNGRMLDIGCSSGEIMYLAQKQGLEVFGVELNPRTANIAISSGLNVHIGTLETAGYRAGSFNVIYMGDLIEHVKMPTVLIDSAYNLLAPGGQLIITTPNMDCFWSKATLLLYRMFRIPWASATPPHHLFQFSRNNLIKTLVNSGFDITTEWYQRTPTLKYELGATHLLKKLKKNRSFTSAVSMFVGFGLYSILFGINKIVELFAKKKFDMTIVAHKK